MHPSRTSAQEAAATVAVRAGLVEQLRLGGAQLPPSAAHTAPSALGVVDKSSAAVKVVHAAGAAAADAGSAAAASVSSVGGEGVDVSQAGGTGPVAPAAAAHEVEAAHAVAGVKRKLGEEEARVVLDGYLGGAGAAVQQLREGCAAVLGSEGSVVPRYRVSQKGAPDPLPRLLPSTSTTSGRTGSLTLLLAGSLFSASVIVTLDTLSSATRAFGVPPSCPTRDTACDAAAQAALSAGALELVQARHRPPPRARSAFSPLQASSHSANASSKPRRGKQMSPARSGEEQAALRRAAYGGFGAATAATVASAVEQDKAREKEKKAKEERDEVGRNPLISSAASATAQVAQPSLLALGERAAAVGPSRSAGAAGSAHGLVMDGPSVSALKGASRSRSPSSLSPSSLP